MNSIRKPPDDLNVLCDQINSPKTKRLKKPDLDDLSIRLKSAWDTANSSPTGSEPTINQVATAVKKLQGYYASPKETPSDLLTLAHQVERASGYSTHPNKILLDLCDEVNNYTKPGARQTKPQLIKLTSQLKTAWDNANLLPNDPLIKQTNISISALRRCFVLLGQQKTLPSDLKMLSNEILRANQYSSADFSAPESPVSPERKQQMNNPVLNEICEELDFYLHCKGDAPINQERIDDFTARITLSWQGSPSPSEPLVRKTSMSLTALQKTNARMGRKDSSDLSFLTDEVEKIASSFISRANSTIFGSPVTSPKEHSPGEERLLKTIRTLQENISHTGPNMLQTHTDELKSDWDAVKRSNPQRSVLKNLSLAIRLLTNGFERFNCPMPKELITLSEEVKHPQLATKTPFNLQHDDPRGLATKAFLFMENLHLLDFSHPPAESCREFIDTLLSLPPEEQKLFMQYQAHKIHLIFEIAIKPLIEKNDTETLKKYLAFSENILQDNILGVFNISIRLILDPFSPISPFLLEQITQITGPLPKDYQFSTTKLENAAAAGTLTTEELYRAFLFIHNNNPTHSMKLWLSSFFINRDQERHYARMFKQTLNEIGTKSLDEETKILLTKELDAISTGPRILGCTAETNALFQKLRAKIT